MREAYYRGNIIVFWETASTSSCDNHSWWWHGGGDGAGVAAIEAQIARVSAQIAAANITAPIAGVVTAIYNESSNGDCRSSIVEIQRDIYGSILGIPRDAAMKCFLRQNQVLKCLCMSVIQIFKWVNLYRYKPAWNVPKCTGELLSATKRSCKAGEFYGLTIESSAQKMLIVPCCGSTWKIKMVNMYMY